MKSDPARRRIQGKRVSREEGSVEWKTKENDQVRSRKRKEMS